jgi:hypothetical protein
MVIYSSLDSLSIGLIISIPILPICLDISLEIFEIHSLDSLILSFLAKAVNSPIELMDYPIKEYGSSGKVVFTMPKMGSLSTSLDFVFMHNAEEQIRKFVARKRRLRE